MKSLIITTLISSIAFASSIAVKDPYVRVMPPGASASAGFVTFKNSSNKDVKIIAAKAEFAGTTELHTHEIKEGIMQMRKVDSMTIPANGELVLKPHGKHLMFFDLQKSLKANDKVKINFKLSNGESLDTTFEARELKKKH